MLIISLPQHVTPGEQGYDHVHSDGQRVLRHDRANPALLSPHSGEVVGVIAHRRLAWFALDIPPVRQKHQLLRVVHSLLEEVTLQEVSQLHVVLQPHASSVAATGGQLWVAVCDQQWLRQVLAPLQKAGITVQRLVPEFSPTASPALHVIGDEQHTQCVLTHANGVTLLPPHTAQWSAFGIETDHPPHLYATPALAQQVEAYFSQPPTLLPHAQRLVLAAQSEWNLAQGEWAQTGLSQFKRLAQQMWRQWRHAPAYRAARWGLACLVFISILGLNLQAWQAQQDSQAAQAQLSTLFTQTFPNVKVVVDAPLQMQRELDALQQQKGGVLPYDFEPLLSQITALTTNPQGFTHVDYAHHQLQLQGGTLTQEQRQQVQAQLALHQIQFTVNPDQSWTLSAQGAP